MNSAFRDIILLKEFKLAKAVLVSLAVLMIGFALFVFGDVITLAPKGFKPWSAIVGGLVFGIGMVLAAGCASGTTYRVGEGMMGSFVAAIGLTTGAMMTFSNKAIPALSGILSVAKSDLQHVLIGDKTPTGNALLMLIVGLVGIVLMFIFWGLPAIKKKREANEPMIKTENLVDSTFKKAYPWWVTGILIGIILTAGYVASNGVIGITGGWMDIDTWLLTKDSVMWAGFIIFGIIIGAFAGAYLAGEFKFRVPKDGFTIVKQFIGGGLMGFGAVVAMGCNITNILGGVPQLSLHSIVTGVCIVFGSWIAAYLLFMWRKD